MSRSAHAQGAIKLRELPKCSRCKLEFVLVTVQYEAKNGEKHLAEEWECTKCGKAIAKDLLKEEDLTEFEVFLHNKSKELNEERKANRKRDRERAFANSFKKSNK